MSDPHRSLNAGKLSALRLLKEALDDAEDAGRDRWQFAIRKPALLAAGASPSDLRWLISSRLVEEAIEITAPDDPERVFRPAVPLALHSDGCFVLTRDGSIYVRSESFAANGDAKNDGSTVPPHSKAPASNGDRPRLRAPRPEWHAIKGELHSRGQLVRRRGRKTGGLEEFLLSVFHGAEWEQSVVIKFDEGPINDPEQLKECVRRVNDRLLLDTLRFHVRPDSAVAWWEDRASRSGDSGDASSSGSSVDERHCE